MKPDLTALRGKTLWKSQRVYIHCDGGYPKFHWLPRFRRLHYHEYWKLHGFIILLWGREFHFNFGKDLKGFYET